MTKIEIIGASRSTYVWVVRMVCEEKGIGYELTEVMPHSPEAKALHPYGKIPALRHGDLTLFESKAIATYLDRAFPGPKLIPDDPRVAGLVEQWVSLVNSVVDVTLVRTYIYAYIRPRSADGAPDRAAIAAVVPAMHEQLRLLDNAVARTGFLAGDNLTLADLNLLPILYRVRQFPEGAAALAETPGLGAYLERLMARPSAIKTEPPPGAPRSAKPS